MSLSAPTVRSALIEYFGSTQFKISRVQGGDINQAFKAQFEEQLYFVKANDCIDSYRMFLSEATFLEYLLRTGSINVPEVLKVGRFEGWAFLIMEYISHKSADSSDMRSLGVGLSRIHSKATDRYGWYEDNYIGTLVQCNCWESSWSKFYLNHRIVPQLTLAADQGLIDRGSFPSDEELGDIISGLSSSAQPVLLHGDLWSGNYLIDTEGVPFLIDPAGYYGDRYVDIAMTHLFGGFSEEFYDAYYGHSGMEPISSGQLALYQLYPMLVHLNLFGSAYLNGVSDRMKVLMNS